MKPKDLIESFKSFDKTCKNKWFFPNNQSLQHASIDVNPHYKRLGLVNQFVGKEKTQQITSEYDHQTLFFPCLCI